MTGRTTIRPRTGRLLGLTLGALLLAGAAALVPLSAYGTQPNPEHKITLCHRTGSVTNPYVAIDVDVASVLLEGHDGHDGPVFSTTLAKHEAWGDIIPAFDFGPGLQYPGKNWTEEGQAIWNDGCQASGAGTTTSTGTPT